MEKEKSTNYTKSAKRLIFIFFVLLITFVFLFFSRISHCKSNNKNKISFKSIEEKNKFYKNYKIWQSLSPLQKKKWIFCQERFQKYSSQDKNFLRTVYRDWLRLSPDQKEEWKKTFMVFQSFSPLQKIQIQYISIFYECYQFENHSLPYRIWIKKFENFFKKWEPLAPCDLRWYIYQTFKLGNILSNLPSGLQTYWLNLPAQTKLKIYSKIEKKLNQEMQHFLFQALKQELTPNLGDE